MNQLLINLRTDFSTLFLTLNNSPNNLIMFQKIVLTVLILLIGTTAKAQDTLQLLNGKTKVVKVSHETSSYVIYQKIKKGDTSNLSKPREMDKQDIFRVSYFYDEKQDSTQKITQVYQVDSLMGDYFTVKEMEMFLEGKAQARKNYKAFKYALVGFGVGAASGYLGSFWGWVPVTGYTSVAGVWIIKPFLKADNPELFNDLHFNAGYREHAKIKQAKYALIGSAVGLVSSLFLWGPALEKAEELTSN
ncbi:MAG: hypothetical protein ACJAZ2_001204 [Glaciecola sp.]